MRGTDSHRRSSGYEPDELLLLHPAVLIIRLVLLLSLQDDLPLQVDERPWSWCRQPWHLDAVRHVFLTAPLLMSLLV